jgi:hypothetical protein
MNSAYNSITIQIMFNICCQSSIVTYWTVDNFRDDNLTCGFCCEGADLEKEAPKLGTLEAVEIVVSFQPGVDNVAVVIGIKLVLVA